jgi:hypothetical protein
MVNISMRNLVLHSLAALATDFDDVFFIALFYSIENSLGPM